MQLWGSQKTAGFINIWVDLGYPDSGMMKKTQGFISIWAHSGNLGIQDGGIPVLSFGQDEQGEVYYTVQSPSGRSIFKFVRDE